MECKKCNAPGTVILRKKDSYCTGCFLTNTNHKFRACIGKNKMLSKNDNVLVCLSGGTGSTVLLDLIFCGMSMNSHKKLRITPYFLHIIEQGSSTQVDSIIKQCVSYNFKLYLVHISQYLEDNLELETPNIPPATTTTTEQYQILVNGLPSTASNDLIPKIKRNLFIKCAEKLKCRFIFSAETTTTLAIKLLSNLALGRGSQVENAVGFIDDRNKNMKILKPMKDISHEELMNYINIKSLSPVCCDTLRGNSLQSVIGTFVTDLQENFPATISTVCKTADKIGVKDETQTKKACVICESELGNENSNLTAFEATKFSRMVSYTNVQLNKESTNSLDVQDGDVSRSLFPHIHTQLCYGCSRIYSSMDKCHLPIHVQNKLKSN